ncbi:MAG: hypothetical protein ACJ735_13805 [Actinomycetes bacterium]
MVLNNRELASAIILATGLVLICLVRDLRSGLWGIASHAFVSKLSVLWLLYAATMTGAVFGLRAIGLRYQGSVKDAVVWALIAGLPIYFKFADAATKPGLLARALLTAVKLTGLIEFFVNLYIFPIWVELPVQLVLVFVGFMSGVANADGSVKPGVRRFVNGVASLAGLVVLAVVGQHVATHWSDINWRETALSFLQPVALTIPAAAITAVVTVVAAYEMAFVRLQYPKGSREPRFRHRAAMIAGLNIRLTKLSSFAGAVTVRLREALSFRDALSVVRAYRRGEIGPSDWPGLSEE